MDWKQSSFSCLGRLKIDATVSPVTRNTAGLAIPCSGWQIGHDTLLPRLVVTGEGGIVSPVVDTPLFPPTGSPSGNA